MVHRTALSALALACLAFPALAQQAPATDKAVQGYAPPVQLSNQQDHQRMLTELKREVGRLVVQTTATVTGKILTPEDQRRISEYQSARMPGTIVSDGAGGAIVTWPDADGRGLAALQAAGLRSESLEALARYIVSRSS